MTPGGEAKPRHEGVVILGTPRSGTTLLRRLLDAHPNIACPGETGLLSAAARFLECERIAEGVEIGALSGLAYAGFDRGETMARLREFVYSFHREHAQRAGKPRWAEKTAFDSFHVDKIEALCAGHANFVCVIRHPLDFVCSMQELSEKNQRYLREVHEYIRRDPRPLHAFARIWADLTPRLLRFAREHEEDAILVKYEDLVEDPQGVMAGVLEAIGEGPDASFIDEALAPRENLGLGDWKTYSRRTVEESSVDRWKRLSRNTIGQLAAIVGEGMHEAGYEPIESEEPDRSEEEARRRYELGLMLGAVQQEDESGAAE